MKRTPHPIPYQGSKRSQAAQICSFIRPHGQFRTLYEPFAGSAAVSLYAAAGHIADNYVLGDSCTPLVGIWQEILNNPHGLADQYEALWKGQPPEDTQYFTRVRQEYNTTRDQPHLLLYLIVRCVKNAIRFNARGHFTQSSDKRRLGMQPDKMRASILGAHYLLRGKTSVFAGDYKACIKDATPRDIVYMDPPYQGTSTGNDKRYFQQLQTDDLISTLHELNAREVHWILSYDGTTGEKTYGAPLPSSLKAHCLSIHVGRSTQSTLNGKSEETIESLYLSHSLCQRDKMPQFISLASPELQPLLFAESFR